MFPGCRIRGSYFRAAQREERLAQTRRGKLAEGEQGVAEDERQHQDTKELQDLRVVERTRSKTRENSSSEMPVTQWHPSEPPFPTRKKETPKRMKKN